MAEYGNRFVTEAALVWDYSLLVSQTWTVAIDRRCKLAFL
jgi:hypothetical protein